MAEVIENGDSEVTESTSMNQFASKATGNAGLALGIIGTALSGLTLLGGGIGSLLGKSTDGNSVTNPNTVNMTDQEVYLERQQCQNYLDITKQYYEGQASQTRQLTDAFFDAYKRDIDNSFGLYKYSRDNKDELSQKIEAVDKKVDVMAAIRPYQDALINAKIDNASLMANYNLDKRTCKMITGQVVLPSTPVISGYGSYIPYISSSSTTTTTTT